MRLTADGGSYIIYYCLGSQAGTINSGGHCATPDSINTPGVCNWTPANGFICKLGASGTVGDQYSCDDVKVVQYGGGPYDAA